LAAVRLGEEDQARFGFVDQRGNIIVPVEFIEVRCFTEGLAWVRAENGWGILEAVVNYEPDHAYGDVGYIYHPIPEYQLFTPPSGVLNRISDTASAHEAISGAIRALTPRQRQAGGALNYVALYMEHIIRRGTTQTLPPNEVLSANVLHGSAHFARNIRGGVLEAMASESIRLMRPIRANINYISPNPGFSVSFPDDISAIDFDYITVESELALITLNRNDIPVEGYVGLQYWQPDGYATENRIISYLQVIGPF